MESLLGRRWELVLTAVVLGSREFEIEGDRFLSRQAWLPEGPDELTRVMERSFDDGETWEARSRTRFRRVPPIEATPTECGRGG